MIRTCYNCIHFCATLCDPEDTSYHIHNWCKLKRTILDPFVMADRYEYKDIYHDDLETGDACCYLFEPRQTPAMPDEWFENNRRRNIQNRLDDME